MNPAVQRNLSVPWDGCVQCQPCARQPTLRMVHISSASQATSSSTRATPLNFQMPPRTRSMVISSTIALELPDAAANAVDGDLQHQLVARLHGALEART